MVDGKSMAPRKGLAIKNARKSAPATGGVTYPEGPKKRNRERRVMIVSLRAASFKMQDHVDAMEKEAARLMHESVREDADIKKMCSEADELQDLPDEDEDEDE